MFLKKELLQNIRVEAKAIKKQILILGILVLFVSVGLSGCETTYDLKDFKVTLANVNIHLFNRNYIEIWFNLEVNNFYSYFGDRDHLILRSLNYTISGNSHYLSGGVIKTFYDGSTILYRDFEQFNDTLSLNNFTINSELNNTINNKQPITWSVSGELTLYERDNTSILIIPFDGLTYNMTEYN